MHEDALPPDPGKPHPEDVLKTLCPAELDYTLLELCGEAEISLTPYDRDSENVQASASPPDEGMSIQLGCGDSNNFHALPSKHQKGKDVIRYMSTQDSLPQEEVSALETEKEVLYAKSLSDDGSEPTEVIGTADQKVNSTVKAICIWVVFPVFC